MCALSLASYTKGNEWWAFRDFLSLFLPVWFQWAAVAGYLNRFEQKDVVYQFFFMGNLLLMAFVGVSLSACGEHDSTSCKRFAFSMAGARAFLVAFFAYASYFNPTVRKVITPPLVCHLLVAALWLGTCVFFCYTPTHPPTHPHTHSHSHSHSHSHTHTHTHTHIHSRVCVCVCVYNIYDIYIIKKKAWRDLLYIGC